jgi:hypothetical protein
MDDCSPQRPWFPDRGVNIFGSRDMSRKMSRNFVLFASLRVS